MSRTLVVAVALLASYALGLHFMISSDAAMAILSSGGHFPAWAILATLVVLLLRVAVVVALPAALFAKLGVVSFDAWPCPTKQLATLVSPSSKTRARPLTPWGRRVGRLLGR